MKDIQPELTSELIALSEWMGSTHVIKRISMLEVMLPSAIKAKYKKAFKMKDDIEVPSALLQNLISMVTIIIKMRKNNDIQLLMKLLKEDIVEEKRFSHKI